MGRLMVVAVRAVLAMMLAGSVFVQVVMVPLIVIDMDEAEGDLSHLAIPFVAIVILGIATAQVTVVCVWRLVTMVRRGTVFSPAAFRYVDIIIGAAGAAAMLAFALAVLFAPGEAVPPGIVLLICGGSVVAIGIGLVVLVMRTLLSQAISREVEAHELRAELEEVI